MASRGGQTGTVAPVAIPLDDPERRRGRPGVSPAAIARPYAGGFGAPPPTGLVPRAAAAVAASATGSAAPATGVVPAPLGRRARSAAIDLGLVAAPVAVAGLIGYFAIFRPACRTYPFLDGTRTDCSDAGGAAVGAWTLVIAVFVAAVVVAEVLPLVRRGATWGMGWSELALVDDRGARVSWPKVALRSLLRWTVSLELLGMGFWWAAVDARRLTFHDLICRTVVVDVAPSDPVEQARERSRSALA